jgi:hypothetical protein
LADKKSCQLSAFKRSYQRSAFSFQLLKKMINPLHLAASELILPIRPIFFADS